MVSNCALPKLVVPIETPDKPDKPKPGANRTSLLHQLGSLPQQCASPVRHKCAHTSKGRGRTTGTPTSSGLAQLYMRLLGQLVSRCCRSVPEADRPGNSAVT